MHLLCMVKNNILFLQINSAPFVGMGVVVWKGTVVQFSLPHHPLSPWLAACVCDFPFEQTMSDAYGPMTHAACVGSVTLAPS